MRLTIQKRLAASILKCSEKRVWFDQESLEEIKEAITKVDIKGLINKGIIGSKPAKGISRGRARKAKEQKAKGRRSGKGKRKGTQKARNPQKKAWMNKIRSQRELIKELRDKDIITTGSYRTLYNKSKGGFFRSKRHIKLFIEENKLAKKK